MLRIAVLGCGRIGRMHAANIAAHPRAALAAVYDTHTPSARAVAQEFGCPAARSDQEILGDDGIDALLVATATPTHADHIEAAVAAGKPVLCEKPIDLSLARVDACATKIAGREVAVQIGFNRRFDPSHKAARDMVAAGDIGTLHQVIITSRDPGLPDRAYLRSAGGIFRDMVIHDFDLARFLLGDEPVEVFAIGGRLIDPDLMDELGDHDTTMVIMRTSSGRQCQINTSRASTYGYDQRVELLGSAGMIQSQNRGPLAVRTFDARSVEGRTPYFDFFVERYSDAFNAELDAFIDAVEHKKPVRPGFDDGRRALVLAEAATKSAAEGRFINISEVS